MAVISDVEIVFEPGLNLLTGETGSGKSIIVDALSLLVGARSSQEMIRTGQDRAYVEAIFRIEPSAAVCQVFAEAGLEAPGDEILIRRVIHRDGPSRSYLNDRLATVSLLKKLRPCLIDIYGQGDHQSLLYPEGQLNLLDRLAGSMDQHQQVRELFNRYRACEREIERLQKSDAERLQLIDIYQYQISEIERSALAPGEDIELDEQRRILKQAEKLARLTGEAYERLYESDDSMLTVEAEVRRWIRELCAVDSQFELVLQNLERSKIALEESAFFLRDYLDTVTRSPERLEEIEDRLAEIQRLKRKYGSSIEDILRKRDEMARELRQLKSSDEARLELRKQEARLESDYRQLAEELTTMRTRAARELEEAVGVEMNQLALEQGQIAVLLRPVGRQPAEHGVERVEILVSLNPGEELKPLARVASGGEISRLMLAIKSVVVAESGPRALVFDEIDVGVGGRVAEHVGARLKKLAEVNQVLCVTHQPQIARFADAHYRVEKEVAGGSTKVGVVKLDRSGRVDELARMLAGARVTDVSRRHARELIRTH